MKRVRARRKTFNKKPRPREPLAEGIVPLDKRGRRWASMSDDEIVAFTRRVMGEKGISSKRKLEKADSGLYQALHKRKLLDRVGFEDKYRDWSSFSDAQLIKHARQFMEEEGISGRSELLKADGGLYHALHKRKLLDRVGFEDKYRDWRSLSDEQLVEHARQFMEENGINGRGELQKADSGLYEALRVRKLLDRIGFGEIKRGWSSLSDEQLVEHARQFMEENGISGRGELQKADRGLYGVLRRRKLLDRVGFEEKRRKMRDWSSFSDAQLVEHARRFVEEKGISSRKKLYKADSGLCAALWRRKLLDRVFADIEQAKERKEIQAIFDGLAEFSK